MAVRCCTASVPGLLRNPSRPRLGATQWSATQHDASRCQTERSTADRGIVAQRSLAEDFERHYVCQVVWLKKERCHTKIEPPELPMSQEAVLRSELEPAIGT
eukprot:2064433-Pyramimonas_sp.AAC.1